jgi:hypothetical protein
MNSQLYTSYTTREGTLTFISVGLDVVAPGDILSIACLASRRVAGPNSGVYFLIKSLFWLVALSILSILPGLSILAKFTFSGPLSVRK